MEKEKEPNLSETELEHIPTQEEVCSVFRELIKGEYTKIRKLEDEQGLYLYDVRVPGDSPDEEIGYEYIRKGHYKEGACLSTEIHVVYYEKGIPVGGTSAARYINGKWIIL